ncbi:phosphoribosyltransferase [Flavobacterium phage vB_FspM_immuto_3-5A]|jgi:uncharacterized protein|uniref:Phosphoribosyltransferase n=1 Tax=Flavobacterium phage vB_FspM_immuto_2-6A TaxID=2801477 RepID=A0A7T8ERU8_9CAUD|nr:phosphoribosyl transferase [Flavobacterium phage vB_FspM_immuto_2-6A]QQO91739.1 phosphoribosyltransferase [Flavobacterium phage vB_FspM_immuto_2-6A]QQO91977.1 phosphoribosyltransferase [Flavobacterium phage vB_FspM_immuto_3-5A]QQO92215.1 phosphoribosyltransferase [Flavobacterium phage vB_FspM_immuto_13-6C]
MALKIGNKMYLSWDDINVLVEDLCNTIATSGAEIKSIAGIKRGGLIPAVMVSHKLNIPYVDRINKDTLVVDDICDTGETLKKSIAMYTATLHYKPTAGFTPDFYAKEVGSDWIVYPWERKDSDAVQDYLKK